MKFIDWFSGIGGFREGFTQAGNSCTVQVTEAVGRAIAMAEETNEDM